MKQWLALLVLFFALGCSETLEPTPTLETAAMPEVAPAKAADGPEHSEHQARAREESRKRWDAIEPLGNRMRITADQCSGEEGLRHEEEFGRLIGETRDAFDGDWVNQERRVARLERELRLFVERLEPLCEKKAARRQQAGAAWSASVADILYALVAGGLCGRYMSRLTIGHGLVFGLVVSLATTAIAAFVPFPGREFVPSAAWLLLAVTGTAAVCWRGNQRGREGSG